MIGKTVAQYKILRKLGEGGMGTVYLAHDTDLDRSKRETRAVAALNHPAIIDIYEIGTSERRFS